MAPFCSFNSELVKCSLSPQHQQPKSALQKMISSLPTALSCLLANTWIITIARLELFSTSRVAMFARIRQEEVQLLLKELFLASTRKPAKVQLTSKLIEWVDFQGVERRMKGAMKKLDKLLQSLLEEHRKMREDSTDQPLGSSDGSNKGTKTYLIVIMLSLQQTEPEFYTDQTIKADILSVIGAGTETSSAIIEWTMSILLNHPGVLHKAWSEIAAEVGHDKLLDETDLPKEPKLWEDAYRFMPERFIAGEPEGYILLPFGVGRRACPGANLGRKVVGLVLGALIQSFEWNRIGEVEIDMKEGTGLTMPKAEPLVDLCSPRPCMLNLLSTIRHATITNTYVCMQKHTGKYFVQLTADKSS
ncbi:putative WPP domain protein 2 [Hibiscus syriacus]|uniref:WPP domain protein 2 n=1 Tax=Hibiscus syriacus TaxID=106335 RepID=A0A6A2YTM2_HIBSY|nr:putative WPP domain protein 2 [Hibiscus syriacus]